MRLSTNAFNNGEAIPSKYTCDGEDINPQLMIDDVPPETKSLAIIMDDPDAPAGTANPGWVHWVVFNIPPETKVIPEGTVPEGATQGFTDFGHSRYGGPCPHQGLHHYVFTLYALDLPHLNLDNTATKSDLLNAMQGHILDTARLVGVYKRD